MENIEGKMDYQIQMDYVLNGLSDEKKEVVMQLIRWLADL